MKAVTPKCQRRLSSTGAGVAAGRARGLPAPAARPERCQGRVPQIGRGCVYRDSACTTGILSLRLLRPLHSPIPTATAGSGGSELSAAEGNCLQSAAYPAQSTLVGACTEHSPFSRAALPGPGPRPSRPGGRSPPGGGGKGKRGEGQEEPRRDGRRRRRWRQLQHPPAPALTFSGGGSTRQLAPPHVTRGRQSAARGAAPAPPGSAARLRRGRRAARGAVRGRAEGGGGNAEAVAPGGCWSLALPTIKIHKIHNQLSFESILLHMQNRN